MKLSLGGYSFKNTIVEGKMDVFGYLETVKHRYHLNAVDLWNGQFCNWQSDRWELPEKSVLQKIRSAIDERELELVNIAVDSAHIWDPDIEKREWFHGNALEHIKASALLGAKSVRIDTGGYELSTFSEEQFELVVKRFQEYCKIAKGYGLVVGPENHMGPSLYPKEMKRIAEAVDRENFGILLHMGRWKEDADQGDEIIAPYVYHTHVSPSSITADNALEKMNLMRKYGYSDFWSVEYNAKQNQYAEIEWLLSSAKRLLLQLDK